MIWSEHDSCELSHGLYIYIFYTFVCNHYRLGNFADVIYNFRTSTSGGGQGGNGTQELILLRALLLLSAMDSSVNANWHKKRIPYFTKWQNQMHPIEMPCLRNVVAFHCIWWISLSSAKDIASSQTSHAIHRAYIVFDSFDLTQYPLTVTLNPRKKESRLGTQSHKRMPFF